MKLPVSFKEFAECRKAQSLNLNNESKCVVCNNDGSPFVYIFAAVRAGVRYEDKQDWGASHFLEHVVMRGTEKFPALREISRCAEGIGGQISAYSTRDLTAYWVRVPRGMEELGFDLLEQVLFKPLLEQSSIDSEREIIIHERQRELANYGPYVSHAVESLLLAPNPMSRHPVGDDSCLAPMDSAYMRSFLQRFYNCGNICIVGSGNLGNDFAEFVKKFWKQAPKGQAVRPANFFVETSYPDGSVVVKSSEAQEQVFVSMGWRFPVFSYNDLLTWRVINALLGAGYSSLLNLELREKNSLTYVCRTAINVYDGMGVFKLYLSAHLKELPKVFKIIEDIVADFAQGSISKSIFEEAVMRHAADLLSAWSSPLETARILGHSLSRDGEIFDVKAYLEELERVSELRAAELVKRWLNPADRLVFMSGSAKELMTLFPSAYVLP
ncbi:MAG: M16 family metallopeptidase [Candidatus Bruticola sp.]